MADAAVHVEIAERAEGRVARVTVDNRQPAQLPLDAPDRRACARPSPGSGEDRALRAVVLTGAGDRAFIGGADLNELGALCADSARLFITRLHQACQAIRDCPVPVIGRIDGFCLGAGLEVAASCDFRAAAEGASSACPRCTWGFPR